MDTYPMPKDYLAQLLANMQGQLDRIEKKTDKQSEVIGAIELHTQAMGKDVEQAQEDIKRLESAKGKKLNLSDRTLYLIALGFVIALVLLASFLKVDLGGLIS